MSSGQFDGVIITDGSMIRDYMFPFVGAVGLIHDTALAGMALGLDVFIHNRGAAPLTIALNGQVAMTVNAGAVFAVNGTKIWLVEVISAVIYDLIISGVRMTTLQKLGLMKIE